MILSNDIRPGMVFMKVIHDTYVILDLIIGIREVDSEHHILEYLILELSSRPDARNGRLNTYKRYKGSESYPMWTRTF